METETMPRGAAALRAFLERDERNAGWLGRKIGCSHPHAWRLTTGNRPITADIADKLAALFGVPAATFLEADA